MFVIWPHFFPSEFDNIGLKLLQSKFKESDGLICRAEYGNLQTSFQPIKPHQINGPYSQVLHKQGGLQGF